VNLGFLDFSSLEARRHFCDEELRLNRRLAPELYLEVVAIRGSLRDPHIDGEGPIIEYAVKMREFAQRALASSMIGRGEFTAQHVDDLARIVAHFHAGAAVASARDRHGTPEAVLASMQQNFNQAHSYFTQGRDRCTLEELKRWARREYVGRRATIAARREKGRVRECHGDLHLGNVVVLAGRPVAFDCIEFNEEFRWIDVMNEVAFLRMDLEDRGRPDLAWRFLNRYLEATDDYAGVEVLRFYAVYRALVRAKVHAMRARQPRVDSAEHGRLLRAARGYLRLASRLATPGRPVLVITHGLSGSGKTTATDVISERLGAVRVRSDLERKRLYGVAPLGRSGSGLDRGIYTPQATAATYERLAQLAQGLLESGYAVVVDAAFLQRAERDAFHALARRCAERFVILDCQAPQAVLRERIARRLGVGKDASEATLSVLKRQLATREPLVRKELEAALTVDTTRPPVSGTWRRVLARLR
jgi:uncharacterized protein